MFLIIGLAALAGAVFWAVTVSDFVAVAQSAPGTVVDLERSRSSDSSSYHPVVKFQTRDGREVRFRSSTGSNPPSYSVGERVEVLYRGNDPADARIRSFFSLWGGPVIVGAIGTAFALIGGGILAVRRIGARRDAELRRRGLPVQARVQGVERNTALRVNGAHPFQVIAQWLNPHTGEVHVFRSNNLWYDPSAHLKVEEVTVYLDRRNPRRYYVDLSFLPRLAE